MASVVKPAPARAPTLPPMRYSAAAAAGSSGAQANSTTSDSSHPPTGMVHSPPPTGASAVSVSTSESQPAAVPPSPSLTHPSVTMSSPVPSSVDLPSASQVSHTNPPSESRAFDSPEASPMLAEAQPAATSSPHRTHSQRGLSEYMYISFDKTDLTAGAPQHDPVLAMSPPVCLLL
jgi:CCR4-NOT transcription complex subunit 3